MSKRLSKKELLNYLSSTKVSDLDKIQMLIEHNRFHTDFISSVNDMLHSDYITVTAVARKMNLIEPDAKFTAQSINNLLCVLGYQTKLKNKNTQNSYTLSRRAKELALGKLLTGGSKESIRWNPKVVDMLLQCEDLT